ncbi:MAG: hypothetical protein ACKVK0_11780 [Pirellulales bacterium]
MCNSLPIETPISIWLLQLFVHFISGNNRTTVTHIMLGHSVDSSIELKWSTSAKVPASGRILEENDRDGSLSAFIFFSLDIM